MNNSIHSSNSNIFIQPKSQRYLIPLSLDGYLQKIKNEVRIDLYTTISCKASSYLGKSCLGEFFTVHSYQFEQAGKIRKRPV